MKESELKKGAIFLYNRKKVSPYTARLVRVIDYNEDSVIFDNRMTDSTELNYYFSEIQQDDVFIMPRKYMRRLRPEVLDVNALIMYEGFSFGFNEDSYSQYHRTYQSQVKIFKTYRNCDVIINIVDRLTSQYEMTIIRKGNPYYPSPEDEPTVIIRDLPVKYVHEFLNIINKFIPDAYIMENFCYSQLDALGTSSIPPFVHRAAHVKPTGIYVVDAKIMTLQKKRKDKDIMVRKEPYYFETINQ